MTAPRTRLQVMIPTTTAQALDHAAQAQGLSRAQTVDRILSASLLADGFLTDATPAPKPKPAPPSVQRPITLAAPLARWLRSQPGTLSAATRQALADGMAQAQSGLKLRYPSTKGKWAETDRVNIRLPAKMSAILRARSERWKVSWSRAAAVYIYRAARTARTARRT